MRKILLVALLTGVMAIPAFAAENAATPKRPEPNWQERKAEIIQRIDKRITRNQEEKVCVQSATSHEDLKACREKFKPEPKENRPPTQK